MIDPFYITIRHDGRAYKLKVVQVLNDCTHEQFDLIGRNRKVTIQSNRPYLRRLGLKHKRPNWVVIEGQVLLPGLLQNYIDELMQIIDK